MSVELINLEALLLKEEMLGPVDFDDKRLVSDDYVSKQEVISIYCHLVLHGESSLFTYLLKL